MLRLRALLHPRASDHGLIPPLRQMQKIPREAKTELGSRVVIATHARTPPERTCPVRR